MDKAILNTSESNNVVTIQIYGNFTTELYTDFRSIYKDKKKSIHYIIDMNKVDYIDSGALGMLLLLREHIGSDPAKIKIIHSSEHIKKIFEMAGMIKMLNVL